MQPTITRIDGRLHISSQFAAENLGFFRSLPESRWDKGRRCWTCLATPRTAWNLEQRFGRLTDPNVDGLATEWQTSQLLVAGDWPDCLSEPWPHQLGGYQFGRHKPATMLACDMGTGKSLIAISLLAAWRPRRVLILCPISVMGVWPRELKRHGLAIDATILEHAGSAKKAAVAREVLNRDGEQLLIVNYESGWRAELAKVLLAEEWDVVILDESHRAKEPQGKASKFCFELSKRSNRKLCLTGTPMPHSPLDIFAQYRFLDAGIYGTTITAFRERYAVQHPTMPGRVVSWKNLDDLHEKYRLLAYRVEAKDVLKDLPPFVHTDIRIDIPSDARRLYEDLEGELIGEWKSDTIKAANAMVKVLRLQQIAAGHTRDDEGVTHEVHEAKRAALIDVVSDLPAGEPVVVFANFTHDLEQIRKAAKALGKPYGELSGRQRDLNHDATYPDGVEVLGVQWQSGGVGIDLTKAAHAFFYSHTFSLGNYVQSLARLHRPGQKRPVTYHHLLARGTIDVGVVRALKKRQELVGALASDEEMTLEILQGLGQRGADD